ncbi:MAG: HAMP domain-containing sensor histidine kinase [Aestuariivirgaceae bacterium]|jgi:signal transduction histidine kinase
MTGAVEGPKQASKAPPVARLRGLSGKVLTLAIVFVMIGEILIFLPSLANYRVTWLKGRIAMAEVAALAVEAAPDNQISDDLRKELLSAAGVEVVALKRDQSRHLVLVTDEPSTVVARYDLRDNRTFQLLLDAVTTMLAGGQRVITIVDKPPNMSGDEIELAMSEAPLFAAMVGYAVNILALSVVLSIIVAGFAFIALDRMLVVPIRRLTRSMVRFREQPEDQSRIIEPSGRNDEIGRAEQELQAMQRDLAGTLQQKSRLAALGLAVSKVSHDLRNMLSTTQLISDRLSSVQDPTVQRVAPKLVSSLDRAIGFLAQTLVYGRAEEAPPRRDRFPLRLLVEEVIDMVVVQASSRTVLYNDVPAEVVVDADRDQLFRVLMNLARNSTEAMDMQEEPAAAPSQTADGMVRITGWREGSVVMIEVRDNGPGVSQRAREHLFEAFRSSARTGGTGLGLAIASELVRAHGGDIRLVAEAVRGAVFHISIPDRVAELRPGRRGQREAS